MTKLCIDLCAGLGGFSQAFKDDKEWEVVTVELSKKFKPTIYADVRHLPFKQNLKPKVLLASPPCTFFSLACPQFPRIGIKQALEVVGACLEAVAFLKPEKYLIENPRARLRHIIGKPPQTIRYSDFDTEYPTQKPTDLWGNIFLPMVKHERKVMNTQGMTYLDRLHLYGKRFPNKKSPERAKIPYGVSQAVKIGAET
jgi:hypothetical protein